MKIVNALECACHSAAQRMTAIYIFPVKFWQKPQIVIYRGPMSGPELTRIRENLFVCEM